MSQHYREKAIGEYGERCQLCESTRNVKVHHIDGDRDNDELGNLLVVCSPCHADIHSPKRVGMPHDRYTNHLPPSSVYGVSEDSELTRCSVTIREDQHEWLKDSPINVSSLVRQLIDDYREEMRGVVEDD